MGTLFLRGVICASYIKTAVQNVKYHRGVPCTPLMINEGGGKISGGWEAQGGPSHPPWNHLCLFHKNICNFCYFQISKEKLQENKKNISPNLISKFLVSNYRHYLVLQVSLCSYSSLLFKFSNYFLLICKPFLRKMHSYN